MSHVALALGAAALLWAGGPAWLLLSGLTLSTLYRNFRFRLLLPAAATMELMVLLPTTLWSLAPWNDRLAVLCQGAIAAQVSIAYAGSGLAKLRLKDWRRGYSLLGLFDRSSFAIPWLGGLLRQYPRLRLCLTWGTVIFELTFFLSLFSGPVGCLAYVLAGVAFHLAIMALMGIHPFFWAFTATYPAVWVTSITIFRALPGG